MSSRTMRIDPQEIERVTAAVRQYGLPISARTNRLVARVSIGLRVVRIEKTRRR